MNASTTTLNNTGTGKGALWTGRIISLLCVLFLLFDAVMKIIKEQHSIDGSAALGWPVNLVPTIGFILLVSTILHIIPKTAIIGAILITAYLGGAVAIMLRVGQPFYFPVIFGILIWVGLYLRDARVKSFF